AAEQATVAEAHIQIDCGMGLGGFAAEEPEKITAVYRNLGSVAVSGIYTYLFSSSKVVPEQLASFNQVLTHLRESGFETGTAHAAGSYSLLHHENSRLDAVRAGSVLMGRCRRHKGDGLEPLGFGETMITDIRWLPKGHTIHSGKLKTLRRATRIAAIPVGYHNGFGITPPPRTLWGSITTFFRTRQHSVQINNQKVRVLGSIGGSETLLDVTDVRCTEGDRVTFVVDPQFARGFKREYR
ncbi:MAG: alanine racemase, partial [Clostridia bacterium]|nr:alanine racemase [Clostridia bacterium]